MEKTEQNHDDELRAAEEVEVPDIYEGAPEFNKAPWVNTIQDMSEPVQDDEGEVH